MTDTAVVQRTGPSSTAKPDLRVGLVLVAILVIAGVAAGAVWAAWSPPGSRALVLPNGAILPDETEAFVAGDGRFAILVLAIGIAAGLLAWFFTPVRGVVPMLALSLGGLLGAVLTWGVGYALGGGSDSARPGTLINQLRLTLHMHGLVFLEAAAASLVYGLCVAFAAADDLGRPDQAPEPPSFSVGPHVELQDAGGHGDGAGAAQEGGLAPQQLEDPQEPRSGGGFLQ